MAAADEETRLRALLADALPDSRVLRLTRVRGGDIHAAYAVDTDHERLFAKTLEAPLPDMYLREAEGLAFLGEACALRVPEVRAVREHVLVLAWVEPGRPGRSYDEELGRGLAALHRKSPGAFGLAHDNYLATLVQDNRPLPTFSAFYGERRLAPLVTRAQPVLGGALVRDLERLITRLPALCGPPEPAARLHGDLWSGNVLCDASGSPVLIDPAVHGGHRELDLAMLQLFGAPSARVFAAYDELHPRAPGHAERLPLMQLYPLLAHVCLFGAAYVPGVRAVLRAYA